ncbi:MAG TPA: bacterial transcriptional activator domain-containing protein [Thermoanaerobaculia bacterium]|jgi:tetratricopeptide (TPR) repeat protein|nr:bacterial transcriptional activator domain-containing protein [Thermoanaerobaculia bacterium]
MNKPKSNAPKDLLLEAKRVSGKGALEDAAILLADLASDYPDDTDVLLMFAGVLFRLKRYAEAAPYFERILEDLPANEWASLGLFHSLWKTGRQYDAIDEIRRFRDSGGDSMEYRRFFKDLGRSRQSE